MHEISIVEKLRTFKISSFSLPTCCIRVMSYLLWRAYDNWSVAQFFFNSTPNLTSYHGFVGYITS